MPAWIQRWLQVIRDIFQTRSRGFNIFISFSGSRSEKLGRWLFSWIPLFIPSVRPYFAGEMMAGSDWEGHIRKYMEEADAAVFCVTPENIQSSFMYYELGLFRGSRADRFAVVIKLGLDQVELPMPLRLYQTFPFSKETVRGLLRLIAQKAGHEFSAVEGAFEERWPQMEQEAQAFLQAPSQSN